MSDTRYASIPEGGYEAVLTTTTGACVPGFIINSTFTPTDPTPLDVDIQMAARKATRVPVECGGRTFVYDGTGALVSTDGVYEEGRGTPEDEAKEAAAAQAAWHNFNATRNGKDWLTNQQAALTDQSAMLAALGQANVK